MMYRVWIACIVLYHIVNWVLMYTRSLRRVSDTFVNLCNDNVM